MVPDAACFFENLQTDAYNRGRDLHINRASSFFDMLHASRQPHLFFVLFFGGVSFSEYFCTIILSLPFSLCTVWRVRRTFSPYGWCFPTLWPRAGVLTSSHEGWSKEDATQRCWHPNWARLPGCPAELSEVVVFSYRALPHFQHAHFIPIVGVGKRGEY